MGVSWLLSHELNIQEIGPLRHISGRFVGWLNIGVGWGSKV